MSASAAARKIAGYALITMDKTAPKIKYAPGKSNSGLRN
jgi:2-(1,2-epoxy-1,2-dihydrophenyl)acetyl-CoA isomerase